jgi:hypothetical protein
METELADKENIKPLNQDAVSRVTQKYVDVPDLAILLRDHAAELVLKYSPQEKALAEAWRLPIAKR